MDPEFHEANTEKAPFGKIVVMKEEGCFSSFRPFQQLLVFVQMFENDFYKKKFIYHFLAETLSTHNVKQIKDAQR
jgi:hypothetical protein